MLAGVLHFRLRRAYRNEHVVASSDMSKGHNPPVVLPHKPSLAISSVIQHGRIIEIDGWTDSGAVVMINGEQAAAIFEGNGFRHFLGPLSKGTTTITVTCQNEEGGVNTQRVAVTVQ